MDRWTVLGAFAAAAVLVSSTTYADPPDQSRASEKVSSPDAVREVFEAHNRERAGAKLGPLTLDPKLTAAAQAHSDDMAAHHKMTHDGSDGSTPSDRIKRQDYHFQNDAENVAEGYPTVEALMRGWVNSEHHRENILGKYAQVGIAVARDDKGTPYWTVNFATPWEKLNPSQAADDLVKALNKERASAGLSPLVASPKLNTAASQIARQFAGADSFDLKGKGDDLITILKRVGYRYRKLAESATSGQPGASEVVTNLMNSPAHKEHLLADFTEIGVGYADSRSGKPYWTLVLARPLRE